MRVIKSISGVLTDVSEECKSYYTGAPTFPLTATDYIYIGQMLPFNHLYFKVGTANAASALIDKIAIWNGTEWKDCVNVVDTTKVSNSAFAQSGFIYWTPKKDQYWIDDDTMDASDTERITGLNGLYVYDHYWIRIKPTASVTAGMTLSWIGNLFSDDNDLETEYPDLMKSKTLTAFEPGKTSWEEQAVRAAEIIIHDLESSGKIIGPGQILDRQKFKMASVSKVAEIAYTSFGPSYQEAKLEARKEYIERLNNALQSIDNNLDGRLSQEESRREFSGKVLRR